VIKTRLGVEPSTTRFAGDWHRRFEAYAARRHGRLVSAIITKKQGLLLTLPGRFVCAHLSARSAQRDASE